MHYTVIDTTAAGPQGVVVPTAVDALALARRLEKSGDREPVIAAEDGWLLTIDELEELAKS
jgi:hypothetical protein